MGSSEKENYRAVPFRFLMNEANSDKCKLEQLTNLFPEMKEIIELELFKINNLTNMINRLSSIYTIISAVDNRDDTHHLFLGPYHISLGAAAFGALHFRNVSTALLASSHWKTLGDNVTQNQKRRHDYVLRRFRRAVRKLILIKTTIDQLRIASILTPYNQYELYTNGIYDLVLSGHIHKTYQVFDDDDFTQQLNDFRSMNSFQKEHSLLASKFVKIQALLQLLTPTQQQQQQNQTDNNAIPVKTIPTQLDETINEKSTIDSSSLCCTQHNQSTPDGMVNFNRSISQKATQFFLPESNSKRLIKHKSRRHSSSHQKQNTNSLPDLSVNNNPSNSDTLKSEVPSISLINNQEDAFVNRISTLLTNYVLSQQSTVIPFQTNDNDEKLGDSRESLLSLPNTVASDDDIFNKFSSAVETNDFNKLFHRIKTIVDNNLSDHQNLSNNSSNKTTTKDLRQELLISRTELYQEECKDDHNIEYLKLPNNQCKLLSKTRSHSCDETELAMSQSNDHSVEF